MEKQQRPLLKIEITGTDKIIEGLSYIALVALWIFVCVVYTKLPETIPTHFTGSGKADGYGDNETIFLGAGICTVMFIGMSFIQRKPHWFNFPVEITPENAQKQYTTAMKMIRMLKLTIVIIFGLIEFHTYKSSIGIADDTSQLYILAILGLVYIPIFYFLIQSSKNS